MEKGRTLTLTEAATQAREIAASIIEGLENDMPEAYDRVFSQSLAVLMEHNTIVVQEQSEAESPQGPSTWWHW